MGIKTLPRHNPPVLTWGCQLTPINRCNGCCHAGEMGKVAEAFTAWKSLVWLLMNFCCGIFSWVLMTYYELWDCSFIAK